MFNTVQMGVQVKKASAVWPYVRTKKHYSRLVGPMNTDSSNGRHSGDRDF